MTRLGIVTGLAFEAAIVGRAARRWLPGPEPLLAWAAGDPDLAYEEALRRAEGGARVLISFGLAGGLDPALAPGTLYLADTVVTADGTVVRTDPVWRIRCQKLARELTDLETGPIAASEAVVVTPADKQMLAHRTGGRAVDMESLGVARAAADTGVPCLILRAIADPAGQTLPRAAVAAMTPQGTVDIPGVLAGLARRPLDVVRMIALARQSASAQRTLGTVAGRLLPRLVAL